VDIKIPCTVGASKSRVDELQKQNLDLVGVHDVRWEGEGHKTDNFIFFYGKGNVNHNL